MNLRLLDYVIAIAKEKSISRAAEKLQISQPALSQQLKKLEQELGTRLFVREKNQLRLTDAGKVYLNGAQSILTIYEQAMERIAHLSHNGRSQITLVYNTSLLPDFATKILPTFQKLHPDLLLSTVDGNVSVAKNYLLAGTADLAVMACHDPAHNLLDSVPLHTEELLLAMPADDPLNQVFLQQGVDLRRLQHTPFILNQANSFFRSVERERFLQQDITPFVLCEISDLQASLKMVRDHKGCAFIPRSMARNAQGIQFFSLEPPAIFNVVICWHKGAVLNGPTQDLIRIMREAEGTAAKTTAPAQQNG